MLRQSLVVFAVICIGLISAELNSVVKEIHPSYQMCANQCYQKFWVKDSKDASEQCESCCAGCRYLAIVGLSEVNHVLQEDSAVNECHKTCDEAGQKKEECYTGCSLELEVAKKDLAKMDEEFEAFTDMSKMIGGIFGGLMPTPFFDVIGDDNKIEPAPLEKAVIKTDDQPMAQDELQDPIMAILRDLGILTPEDTAELKKQDAEGAHNEFVLTNKGYVPRRKNMLGLRDADAWGRVDDDQASTPEVSSYLRGLWHDRNTVQILLVSSITACLFAILWMLCNSSADPVIAHRQQQPRLPEKPPAYNVIYGDEKKVAPVLVVSGFEEEADALPLKLPLGVVATKI